MLVLRWALAAVVLTGLALPAAGEPLGLLGAAMDGRLAPERGEEEQERGRASSGDENDRGKARCSTACRSACSESYKQCSATTTAAELRCVGTQHDCLANCGC